MASLAALLIRWRSAASGLSESTMTSASRTNDMVETPPAFLLACVRDGLITPDASERGLWPIDPLDGAPSPGSVPVDRVAARARRVS